MYKINTKKTKSTWLTFSELKKRRLNNTDLYVSYTLLTISQLALMDIITFLLAGRQKSTLNAVDQMYWEWRQMTSVRV
jgi:hypothetical protein